MVKNKLSVSIANRIVSESLENLGLIEDKENVSIRTFVSKNRVRYWIEDAVYYHGQITKKITPITPKGYLYLLEEGLKQKGYDDVHVYYNLRADDIDYLVNFSIISYDNKSPRKKKRRH